MKQSFTKKTTNVNAYGDTLFVKRERLNIEVSDNNNNNNAYGLYIYYFIYFSKHTHTYLYTCLDSSHWKLLYFGTRGKLCN